MKRWAAVCRLGGIGDNLIAASVLHPLKRLGYMTEVIAAEPNHVVYLNNPNIDKLSIKVPDRDLPKNDMAGWQAWMQSRAHEYDIFLHASHTVEKRHALFPTDTEFWWSDSYRRKLCAGSYIETPHDIIEVPHIFGPLYYSSEEERVLALRTKEKIGRCILWIVCGSRIDKVYPYSPNAIARIIKELNIPVLVMGGPNDKEYSMVEKIKEVVTIQNGTRDGLHLMISEQSGTKCWPLRTSLAVAQVCDLVITPDTGPAWALAFEPMAKILMVSHASAENIGKHWVNTTVLHADPVRVPCWPCHRLHNDPSTCVENRDKSGAACISDISTERLLKAIAAAWAKL